MFNRVQTLLAKSNQLILTTWLKGKNSEVTVTFNVFFELNQRYRPTLLISILFEFFKVSCVDAWSANPSRGGGQANMSASNYNVAQLW